MKEVRRVKATAIQSFNLLCGLVQDKKLSGDDLIQALEIINRLPEEIEECDRWEMERDIAVI